MNRREKIIKELLSTEVTYVESLEALLDNFSIPLTGQILTREQSEKIFLNADAILNLHRPLRKDLEDAVASQQDPNEICVGQIMFELLPWLRLYTTYINGHQQGSEIMEHLIKEDDNFRYALMGCCAGEFTGMLGLSSLRLVIVQRVPRYVLLLKDLLQNTPEDHKDYQPLEKALEGFQKIAGEINEKKREFENHLKAQEFEHNLKGNRNMLLEDCPEIQPHKWHKVRITSPTTCSNLGCKKVIGFGKKYRSCEECKVVCHKVCVDNMPLNCGVSASLIDHNRFLIKDGPVKTIRVRLNSGKKTDNVEDGKPVTLALFSDCLVALNSVEKMEYELEAVIRWSSPSTQRNMTVNQSQHDPTAFVIVAPTDGDIHTFCCETLAERDDWLLKITSTMQEWFIKFQKKKEIVANFGSGIPSSSSSCPEVGSPRSQSSTGMKVTIPHTVPVAGSKGKTFTSYVIDFTDPIRGNSFSLLKRYSDFDKMQKHLKSLNTIKAKKIPSLPQKRIFGDNTDKNFVQGRCLRLQTYLNELLEIDNILSVPCVHQFFFGDPSSSHSEESIISESPPKSQEVVSPPLPSSSWRNSLPTHLHQHPSLSGALPPRVGSSSFLGQNRRSQLN